ncbi:MAG: site-specific integrase [Cyanobacteria bacterium SIG26]|nr:site-specific integrase [Cyanobacteria bacterium SIG26]
MEFVEPIRDKNKIKQVKLILKNNGLRDYLLFLMGINSGLRISDILKLRVKDVLNKEHIEIKEQKTGKYKKFPITKSFEKTLFEYIIEKNPNEWLFPSQKGEKPISRVQAYRIISKACNKAGITTRIGTHTLRKTFGYHFYQEKKDIALLQSILNHSAPSVTLRYIGINQDIIDENLKDFQL